MLLSAEHLSINFGSRQLLEDVNFYLNEGDKVGVIGINGTGKSTFLSRIPPWRMTPPFWSRYSCISPRNSGN